MVVLLHLCLQDFKSLAYHVQVSQRQLLVGKQMIKTSQVMGTPSDLHAVQSCLQGIMCTELFLQQRTVACHSP